MDPWNTADSAHINKAIGGLIHLRRKVLGLTQAALAKRLNVSPQQVQKYEIGENRLRFCSLGPLCRALEVPLTYFLSPILGVPALGAPPVLREDDAEPFGHAVPEAPAAAAREPDYLEQENTFLLQFLHLNVENKRVVMRLVRLLFEDQQRTGC